MGAAPEVANAARKWRRRRRWTVWQTGRLPKSKPLKSVQDILDIKSFWSNLQRWPKKPVLVCFGVLVSTIRLTSRLRAKQSLLTGQDPLHWQGKLTWKGKIVSIQKASDMNSLQSIDVTGRSIRRAARAVHHGKVTHESDIWPCGMWGPCRARFYSR